MALRAAKSASSRVSSNRAKASAQAEAGFRAQLSTEANAVTVDVPPSPQPSRVEVDARIAAVLDALLIETNRLRVEAGVRPLVRVAALDTIARGWVHHLGATGRFEHDVADDTHVGRAGCGENPVNPVRTYSRDNIAKSVISSRWYDVPGTASLLASLWMGSPGHRASLLDSDVHYTGFGAFYRASDEQWIVEQIFTSRDCSPLVS